jgi:hypothetical protein
VCVAPGGPALPPGWSCGRAGEETVCTRPVSSYPEGAGVEGWRCRRDEGGARACVPRGFGNAPWRCEDEVCRRRYPDFPNDLEWECYDSGGRVLCRSQEPAPTHPAWACGSPHGYPLCVDPDPDVPDPRTEWACRYHAQDGARQCRPASAVPCRSDGECARGVCLEGTCRRPLLAECFLDQECPSKRCVGGVCGRP